jgi:hypothetical protein
MAARCLAVRAIVADGLIGGLSEAHDAGAPLPVTMQFAALFAVGALLGGQGAGPDDGELAERLRGRPLLLISAGRGLEADVNRDLARRAGPSARLWNLPQARHGGAIEAEPRRYERRVTAFLDRALGA